MVVVVGCEVVVRKGEHVQLAYATRVSDMEVHSSVCVVRFCTVAPESHGADGGPARSSQVYGPTRARRTARRSRAASGFAACSIRSRSARANSATACCSSGPGTARVCAAPREAHRRADAVGTAWERGGGRWSASVARTEGGAGFRRCCARRFMRGWLTLISLLSPLPSSSWLCSMLPLMAASLPPRGARPRRGSPALCSW